MRESQAGIHCQCGQFIRLRDLVQMVLGMVGDTPVFVYVKYECPNCQRKEWRYVTTQDLQACLQGSEEPEAAVARQERRGPIDVDEVIDFYEALEHLTPADWAELVASDSSFETPS
jgi:hypothetical protein